MSVIIVHTLLFFSAGQEYSDAVRARDDRGISFSFLKVREATTKSSFPSSRTVLSSLTSHTHRLLSDIVSLRFLRFLWSRTCWLSGSVRRPSEK